MGIESSQYNEKKILNISYMNIIIFSVWVFLSVLSSKVNYVGALLSIIEFAIIVLCIICRKYIFAFIVLTISLTFSLEEKSFVYLLGAGRDLYSIFRLPAISVFPFYFITFVLFILVYQRYSKQASSSLYNQRSIKTFSRWLFVLYITGLLTGMINLLVNDNGIANYSWAFTLFVTSCFRILSLFCFIGTAIYLTLGSDENKQKLESSLVECIFSLFIVGTITVLLKWHGYYVNMEDIMLMPLASSLCPVLLLFPVFYKVRRPLIYYICAIVFTIESLFYNSAMGSKFYIIPLLCLLVYVLTVLKKGKVKGLLVIVIVLGLILTNSGAILNLITGSEYGNWKFSQFSNLFSLSGGISGWYNSVDASPRFRIDEFVNICIEYLKKPWYSIFGKGIGGSITHTWGTTNWFRNTGTFQEFQIESGIFISMHESANVLFIRHGIAGLVFFISTIVATIRKFTSSPWAVGGMIWFIFFWGIYFSWWIGAVMLVLALCSRIEGNSLAKESSYA